MKNWACKILVPALIVGLAAIQSFGVDFGRALRYSREDGLWQGIGKTIVDTLDTGQDGADSLAMGNNSPDSQTDSLSNQTDSLNNQTDSLSNQTDSLNTGNGGKSGEKGDDVYEGEEEEEVIPHDTVLLRDEYGLVRDTILVPSALKETDSLRYAYYPALKDSITRTQVRNALIEADDTSGLRVFDSLFVKDSIEAYELWLSTLSPRDTIVVPDSLKYTDPFKYKYYIAIRDPETRKQTRDSLISIEDSLELFRLDSLYVKDSAEVAEAAFLAWYWSLDKKERKKYNTEQAFQKKLAEVNAKVAMKDSLKYIRDSITQATPRILETYAVPDSMQYKRLIMWQHDRKFNDVNLMPQDTTYNYHFHDQPSWKRDLNTVSLGISGSATEAFNFFRREEMPNVFFYNSYADYTYTAENLPMYNTKTPYTELAYWGTLLGKNEKEETNIRVMTTQNILPSLNIMLEYDRYGGNGMLQNESTDNRTFVAAANYLGKRYVAHMGYIYNKVSRTENGGMTDNSWIRDTTVDAKEIEVFLNDASSKIKQNTIFLDQTYRIPFSFIRNIQNGVYKERRAEKAERDSLLAAGDSSVLLSGNSKQKREKSDTLDRDITTAFIGHSSEYSVYTRNYKDGISSSNATGSDFYHGNFFINPNQTIDSLRVMRFDNRVYIRIQPWKPDGIVSKLDVGIGDKMMNYYNYTQYNYIKAKNNTVQNSVYLYAGVRGQYRNIFTWDATGDYTFLGDELNDFGINANIEFNWYPFRRARKSPLTVNVHFETSMREPDYYMQHIYTNHYKWDNDFGKISTTKIEAKLSIPLWKLEAEFDYALLNNNLYFDNTGYVQQNGSAMSVMSASLMKNFTVWWLHFDHKALFQLSSNEDVLPLPKLSLTFRYYLQMDVVKRVMQMQLGAEARWFTKWYMQGYNPALGVFYNQNEEKYGNYPYMDAFLNIQWKRACIFIKVINVAQGWPKHNIDYFSAHHYINSQMALKFGLFWPFYVQPSKNKGAAAKAAAAGG